MGEQTFSNHSRLVAALLCFMLGAFGAHRFYVGKIGTAILMILTLGGLGLWVIIDLIVILVGSFRDADGYRVMLWQEPYAELKHHTDRIATLERRITDIQDIVIALDERLTRFSNGQNVSVRPLSGQ